MMGQAWTIWHIVLRRDAAPCFYLHCYHNLYRTKVSDHTDLKCNVVLKVYCGRDVVRNPASRAGGQDVGGPIPISVRLHCQP